MLSKLKKFFHYLKKNTAVQPDEVGLNLYVFLMAFVLTILFYLTVNSGLKIWLYSANYKKLSDVRITTSASECANDYLRKMNGDPSLKPWLEKNLRPELSYLEQVVQLTDSLNSVVQGKEKNTSEKIDKLQYLVNGKSNGLLFPRPEKLSGNEILNEITDEYWIRTVEEKHFEPRRDFIVSFLNEIVALRSVHLRSIFRINGSIQNIIVFVAFLCFCLLFRRYRMLKNYARQQENKSPENNLVKSHINYADVSEDISLEKKENNIILPSLERTEECIYRPISFFIASLPSLGFIGTVLGMGSALLKADNLFRSTDKQQVMGELTYELGYAFDTTLVALVLSLLLDLFFVSIRTFEAKLAKTKQSQTNE